MGAWLQLSTSMSLYGYFLGAPAGHSYKYETVQPQESLQTTYGAQLK